MPVIIKEVYFPPDTNIDRIDPVTKREDKDRSKKLQEIATLIESALVYQNTANYEMAIKSLEDARSQWRSLNYKEPQKPLQTEKGLPTKNIEEY